MSSSVFIERNTLPYNKVKYENEARIVSDSELDSNLVVVYGKNGISFDEKGIQRLIDEKHVSSISVIRLTSPTPSMQSEEKDQSTAEATQNESEYGAGKLELNCTKESLITKLDRTISMDRSVFDSNEEVVSSTEEGSPETTDDSSHQNIAELRRRKLFSSSESEEVSDYSQADGVQCNDKVRRNKVRHPRRNNRRLISAQSTAKKKPTTSNNKTPIVATDRQPAVVGLRVEDFYSSNDANILIKHAFEMAGMNTTTIHEENEVDQYPLFVVRNDHCYTPFTSPTQKKLADDARLAAENNRALALRQSLKATPVSSTPPYIAMKQVVIRKDGQRMVVASPLLAKSNNGKVMFTTKCVTKRGVTNTIGPPTIPANIALKSVEKNRDHLVYKEQFLQKKDRILPDAKKKVLKINEADRNYGYISVSEVDTIEAENNRESEIDYLLNQRQYGGHKKLIKLVKISKKNLPQGQQYLQRSFITKSQMEPHQLTNCAESLSSVSVSGSRLANKIILSKSPPRLLLHSTPANICLNVAKSTATTLVRTGSNLATMTKSVTPCTSSIGKVVVDSRRILNKGVALNKSNVIASISNQIKSVPNLFTLTNNNHSYENYINNQSINSAITSPTARRFNNTCATNLLNKSVSIAPTGAHTTNQQNKGTTFGTNIKLPQRFNDAAMNNQLIINKKLRGGIYLRSATPVTVPVVQKEVEVTKSLITSSSSTFISPINTLMHPTSSGLQLSTPSSINPIRIDSEIIRGSNLNNLSVEMPREMHLNTSDVTEDEKQLDLIDAIVKDELEKSKKNLPISKIGESIIISEDIPELVKMLKSSEETFESSRNVKNIANTVVNNNNAVTDVVIPEDDIKQLADATVDDIDIADIELLASSDDLPDDILQDVVELMEKNTAFQGKDSNSNMDMFVDTKSSTIQADSISTSNNTSDLNVNNTSILQNYKEITITSIAKATTNDLDPTTTGLNSLKRIDEQKNKSKISQLIVRKEPIQIVRGNGRVITLPPIEAPTTRAKRRAQTTTTIFPTNETVFKTTVNLEAASNESSTDVSMQSLMSSGSIVNINSGIRDQQNSPESVRSCSATPSGQKSQHRLNTTRRSKRVLSSRSHTETESAPSNDENDHTKKDDDDPNKLWCVCRQPHNNRFMICCDICGDWFHGTCVNITKAMGLEMEQKSIDWTCPNCFIKQGKKQLKITDMFSRKLLTDGFFKNSISTSTIEEDGNTSDRIEAATTSCSVQSDDNFNKCVENTFNISRHEESYLDIQHTKDAMNIYSKRDLSNKEENSALKDVTSSGPIGAQRRLAITGDQLQDKQEQNDLTLSNKDNIDLNERKQGTTEHFSKSLLETNNKTTRFITSTTCIVCKNAARKGTIYCSDNCIRKHAQSAINQLANSAEMTTSQHSNLPEIGVGGQNNSNLTNTSGIQKVGCNDKTKKKKELFNDMLSMANRKPKIERISVYERKSGRILLGSSAPTINNLKKWLQDNPTFEVVQSGSVQAQHIEKHRQRMRLMQETSIGSDKSSLNSNINKTTKVEVSLAGSSSTQEETIKPIVRTIKESNITKPTVVPNSDLVRTSTAATKVTNKYLPQVNIKLDKSLVKPGTNVNSAKKITKDKIVKRTPMGASCSESNNSLITTASTSSEQIRVNVRRTLREHIMQRMEEDAVEIATFSGGDMKNGKKQLKLTADEVDEMVQNIELAMYEYFNYDTGTKYRAKYRSLIFNIKDRKNCTLFTKICNKSLEPKQLVRLTAEEMASQELAQWREKETKHQLDIIKKSELDILLNTKSYESKSQRDEVLEEKAIMNTEFKKDDNLLPVEDVASILNNSSLSSSEGLDESVEKKQESAMESSCLQETSRTLITTKNLPVDSEYATSLPINSETPKKYELPSEGNKETTNKSSKERDNIGEVEKIRERNYERTKHHKNKDRHRSKSKTRKRSRSHSRSVSQSRSGHTTGNSTGIPSKRHKDAHKTKRSSRERHRAKEKHSRHEERRYSSEGKMTTSNHSIYKEKDKPTLIEEPVTSSNLRSYNLIDRILESTKTIEEAANLVSPGQKERESIRKMPCSTSQNSETTQVSSSVSDINCSSSTQMTDTICTEAFNSITTSAITTLPLTTPIVNSSFTHSGIYSDGSNTSEDLSNKLNIWKGNINMIDVASFQISLQPVLGNSLNLGKLLPIELDVVGRISPGTVWEYISKLRKSPNKEVIVTRLVPLNESEKASYTVLYQYLENRSRLGVIKTVSSHIKDFYIYPLGAGKTIPTVLTPSNGEHVELYEDSNRPNIMLGILIRIHGKRSQQVAGNSSSIIVHSTSNNGNSNSTSSSISKFLGRVNGSETYSSPSSPKKKRHRNITTTIDLDAIIKAPIASKTSKAPNVAPTSPLPPPPPPPPPIALINETAGDEPYSPGGSPEDLDLLSLRISSNMNASAGSSADMHDTGAIKQKPVDIELARKMDELNRQIAAQEMEIAGILTRETTVNQTFPAGSSNVLANISIPSNLSQILASIKAQPVTPVLPAQSVLEASTATPPIPSSAMLMQQQQQQQQHQHHHQKQQQQQHQHHHVQQPKPKQQIKPLMETLVLPPSPPRLSAPYDFKSGVKAMATNKTSRLSQLTEAELLQMVPDDMLPLTTKHLSKISSFKD